MNAIFKQRLISTAISPNRKLLNIGCKWPVVAQRIDKTTHDHSFRSQSEIIKYRLQTTGRYPNNAVYSWYLIWSGRNCSLIVMKRVTCFIARQQMWSYLTNYLGLASMTNCKCITIYNIIYIFVCIIIPASYFSYYLKNSIYDNIELLDIFATLSQYQVNKNMPHISIFKIKIW